MYWDKKKIDFEGFLEIAVTKDIKLIKDLFFNLIDILPDEIKRDFLMKSYRDISKVMSEVTKMKIKYEIKKL